MPSLLPPRAAVLTVTALLLSTVLAGCGDDAQGEDVTRQELSWKACPAPDEAQGGGASPSPLPDDGEWQCATMKAPLDWDDPKGDTIGLELIRVRTTGAENERIGSLIFNFGGPGGSGVTSLPAFAEGYEKLRTRYDLVSFDPRGVGRSDPVICENDQQLDAYFQQDGTPDDAAERARLLDSTTEFNDACEQNSGKILPHVRTTDAARDLDLMRQVLGDGKLHYFGISYGTELGGVYAHLFPQRVGRAVFDAVVDPTQNAEQSSLGQAKGFQLALDNFAEDCVSKTEECPIGDSAQDVKDRIARLLDDLDRKPIEGIFPRQLTQTAATSGILQALYSKDLWEFLTDGLVEAYDGNGSTLMFLSDTMNGRSENGEYDNSAAAFTAISCADAKPRYDAAYVERRLPEFRAASPLFGDSLAWGMTGCTDWAVAGAAEHPDVSAPGAAPILVVGNTGDPATPYEGARAMVNALGQGVGVELTYRGQGHGAYDSKNKCVQGAVNGYLLDGKVPPAGTVCT
ncbi:alpha/beta fold hydrolase [Streptomyces violaceochromogenes]|uniref:Alpha/beta fold hydrolase n=1 Tax=Streptomyces violaceochromogenes TaxID=67377 RepID=A0ABU6M6V5_9ACTN|nr:alpha/beta fold hydrolase [Streptomyces violaceochromogenes]MEC7056557.1 alpha/beta fold hydrolase [Streptomyces violaceochromogenes]GHC66506.1 peptidase [Streptomyces violaceochromogenes]